MPTLGYEMATDKTATLRVRLDVKALAALTQDATDVGMAPGTLARRLIEKRYLAPANVGESKQSLRKSKTDAVEFE